MSGFYDPDAVGLRTVETRSVELHGAIGIGYGVDSDTRERVTFTGEAGTLRDFAAALADGVPYVVALVPEWDVLSRGETPMD